MPEVHVDFNRALLTYHVRGGDRNREVAAAIELGGIMTSLFTREYGWNLDVSSHPLARLAETTFFEVRTSGWIAGLNLAEDCAIAHLRHLVFQFEDETFECICGEVRLLGYADGGPDQVLAMLVADPGSWVRRERSSDAERRELGAAADRLGIDRAVSRAAASPLRDTP